MLRSQHRFLLLLALTVPLVGHALTVHPSADPGDPAADDVRFGVDASSLEAQIRAGIEPDLASVWVGPWTLDGGWPGIDRALAELVSHDVVPVIQFYYWGDDMSPGCLEDGCQSALHGTFKDREGWQRLAVELMQHLDEHVGGGPVVIILETEFNRADVATHEPLDGYLAQKARFFKETYPSADVVLGLGNWNRPAWSTWDRAAAESDYIGIQALRAATRDSTESYLDLAGQTLKAAKHVKLLFNKPIVVHDLGLSSFPEPMYALHQADALHAVFDNLSDLKEQGVRIVIYRSWFDRPSFDQSNYFQSAERHWGLAWAGARTIKPAGDAWTAGVQAERGGAAVGPSPARPIRIATAGGTAEVDRFAIRTDGAPLVDDEATGGIAWNLWADGYALHRFRLDPGLYEVAVRARATEADGSGADFEVRWNDTTVLAGEAGIDYEAYAATVGISGQGSLSIRFGNDVMTGDEDRNLILDVVSFSRVDPSPVARFEVHVAGMSVHVDAHDSWAPYGEALTFEWSFGDEAEASGLRANHTFEDAGVHTITLTVRAGSDVDTETARVVTPEGGQRPPAALLWSGFAVGLVVAIGVLAALRAHARRRPGP